jgi:hypothetical protein
MSALHSAAGNMLLFICYGAHGNTKVHKHGAVRTRSLLQWMRLPAS